MLQSALILSQKYVMPYINQQGFEEVGMRIWPHFLRKDMSRAKPVDGVKQSLG